MLYFCTVKNKKVSSIKKEIIMSLNQFAYFYGFYFYFAGNCEAGSCV